MKDTIDGVKRDACESSSLASWGYFGAVGYDGGILAVEFKNGHVFHYKGVPGAVAKGMHEAESIGRYFGTIVKGHYAAEKMTGKCQACGEVGVIGEVCDACGDSKVYAEARSDGS